MKRLVYSVPVMQRWRDRRKMRRYLVVRDHPDGFRFAGLDAFFRPTWESCERELVRERLSSVDVFIDVGANHGYYSCLAASMGVHVVAVEPEPGNLSFLLNNLSGNGFDDVEVLPLGLSDHAGIAQIFGDKDTASLIPDWRGATCAQTIPLNTLDNLVGDRWHGQRLLVKIDVEGLEYQVLQGASGLLERDPKPLWLIETFPTHQDSAGTANSDFPKLFDLMTEKGYRCVRLGHGEFTRGMMAGMYLDAVTVRGCNFLFEAG